MREEDSTVVVISVARSRRLAWFSAIGNVSVTDVLRVLWERMEDGTLFKREVYELMDRLVCDAMVPDDGTSCPEHLLFSAVVSADPPRSARWESAALSERERTRRRNNKHHKRKRGMYA